MIRVRLVVIFRERSVVIDKFFFLKVVRVLDLFYFVVFYFSVLFYCSKRDKVVGG